MASWGRPISTAWTLTWVLERLPRVEPPALSLRLAKFCTGTSACWQSAVNTARLNASVVYFWLALSLMTMPLFIHAQFTASVFSGWFGCTA